ncbi:MAG: hemin uptake protein HemP [Pseudorhodoferax sp.]
MTTATPLPARAAGAGADRDRAGDRRPPRSFDSNQLFAGASEIEIVHQDSVYRLKITKLGKLILNK